MRLKQDVPYESDNSQIALVAQQAAHDIRSPLTALNFIIKEQAENLSPVSRTILEAAIKRINEIATDLLCSPKGCSDYQHEHSAGNFKNIITTIVAEKSICNPSVAFSLNFDSEDYEMPKIPSTILYRILSNILNNSCESKAKHIEVVLSKSENFITLDIFDDGCGISDDQLANIGKKRISFKENGYGLGLPFVVSNLALFGGSFKISSTPATKTKVSLKIPIC